MNVRQRGAYYETIDAFSSGTRFRYLLSNKKSAYVYAFATDDTDAPPTRIFPAVGVSALLDYADNTIAFPGEFKWIQLDNRTGTDYLVVLYSKKALDIAAIERRFAASRGAFPDRVAAAVGANYLPASEVRYDAHRLAFTASSTNPNAVLGLALAIKHGP
jgi:hypothetical protein